MGKRLVLVEIEAGEFRCWPCSRVDSGDDGARVCGVFGSYLNVDHNNMPVRLVACTEAERRAEQGASRVPSGAGTGGGT